MRAERTGCTRARSIWPPSRIADGAGPFDEVRPGLVVVDSVQTMSTTEADGVTGGVTQVRAVTATLTGCATRTCSVAMILVGHVTKDSAIAGPLASVEHFVVVVLHSEGDRTSRRCDGHDGVEENWNW